MLVILAVSIDVTRKDLLRKNTQQRSFLFTLLTFQPRAPVRYSQVSNYLCWFSRNMIWSIVKHSSNIFLPYKPSRFLIICARSYYIIVNFLKSLFAHIRVDFIELHFANLSDAASP